MGIVNGDCQLEIHHGLGVSVINWRDINGNCQWGIDNWRYIMGWV